MMRVFDGFKFGVGLWFAQMIVTGLWNLVVSLVQHSNH